MQHLHQTGFYKGTGSLVKVIEVRNTIDVDGYISGLPLVTWLVIAHNQNGHIHEFHQYDKPIKAQRKFERLSTTSW